MKKEWLVSTSLSSLGKDVLIEAAKIFYTQTPSAKNAFQTCQNVLLAGAGPEPYTHPPKNNATPKPKFDEGVPTSVEMATTLLAEIAYQNYKIWPEDLVCEAVVYYGGHIGFKFAALHNNDMAENREDEPQMYDALYDMVSDLRMFNDDARSSFLIDKLYFEVPNKMVLHDMLSKYLDDEEFLLCLPDDMRKDEGISYLSLREYNENALNHDAPDVTVSLLQMRHIIEQEDDLKGNAAKLYIGLN